MSRLAYELDTDKENLRPADYFDMMGGVGFGGYVSFYHVFYLVLISSDYVPFS